MSGYSVPIRDIIEYYGGPSPPARGGWQTIKCPFHDDRSASARINYNTEKFKCFACNMDGDAIDIVSEREGKDFSSTIEFIEGIIGLTVSDVPGPVKGKGAVSRRGTGILEDNTRVDGRQRGLFSSGGRRKPLAGG